MNEKVIRDIQNVPKVMKKSYRRALNRSLTSTKTQIRKELSKALGIPAKNIGKRIIKVDEKTKNEGSVIVLIKRGFKITDLKPSVKKVRTQKASIGGSRPFRQGVTYRFKGKREVASGVFPLKRGSRIIGVGRRDAFIKKHKYTGKRTFDYPTTQPETDPTVLSVEIGKRDTQFTNHLNSQFEKEFTRTFEFYLNK